MKIILPEITSKDVPFTNKNTGLPDSFIKYSIKLPDGYHDLKAKKPIELSELQKGDEVEVLIQERAYNGKIYKDYQIVEVYNKNATTSPKSTHNTNIIANIGNPHIAKNELGLILEVLETKFVDKEYFDAGIQKLMDKLDGLNLSPEEKIKKDLNLPF